MLTDACRACAQVALVILLQMLVAHATHAMPFFQCDESCQPLANSTVASTNSSSSANASLPLPLLVPLAAAEELEAESPVRRLRPHILVPVYVA